MTGNWIADWVVLVIVIVTLVALAELFLEIPAKVKTAMRYVAAAVVVIILIRVLLHFAGV